MNERKEMADRHGMTIEYVNWFYDNKKESCGNLWLTMLGAMWEGWQASRAAIEIDAPAEPFYPMPKENSPTDHYHYGRQSIISRVRAAGIKVKE